MVTTWFKAVHPYHGDPLFDELSFDAGTVLVVPDPSKVNVNGWTYGHHAELDSYSGWFPSSYVRRLGGARKYKRQKLPIGKLTKKAKRVCRRASAI